MRRSRLDGQTVKRRSTASACLTSAMKISIGKHRLKLLLTIQVNIIRWHMKFMTVQLYQKRKLHSEQLHDTILFIRLITALTPCQIIIVLLSPMKAATNAANFKLARLRQHSVRTIERVFILFFMMHKSSVTRKKSPNVYKSCPKMISLEKYRF